MQPGEQIVDLAPQLSNRDLNESDLFFCLHFCLVAFVKQQQMT